jgi:uncharacterized RDD family membrane protein YckC
MTARPTIPGWTHFRRRVAAYAIDIALLFLALGPTGWLVQRAFDLAPSTGRQIWLTLLLNFSLPTWIYFTAADASRGGATAGKRWMALRAARRDGGRIGRGRALCRTALKLLPWEFVHVSAFALGTRAGDLSRVQVVGLCVANALMLAYLACAALTRGRRSLHDLVAGTVVEAVARPARVPGQSARTDVEGRTPAPHGIADSARDAG